MTGAFATLIQVCVGVFIIWGLFHENKLIRLEDRIAAALRRRFRRRKPMRAAAATVQTAGPQTVRLRPAGTSRPAPVRVCPSRGSHCA